VEQNKEIKNWLLSYAKKFWLPIVALALLSFLKIGFQLINPWPIKILIDSVFGTTPAPLFMSETSPEELLVIITIGLVIIYLLQNLLAILDGYLSSMLDLKFDIDVKSGVFTKLLNVSLASLNKKELGDYIYRFTSETASVRGLIVGISRNVLESSFMLIGALIILFSINWQLAVISLTIVPFLFLSVKHFSPKIESISEEIQANGSALLSHSTSSIQNIRTIQAFDQEPRQSKMLGALLFERYRIALRNLLLHGKFGLTNDMISTVAMSAIIFIGGTAVLQQSLTIGELVIFLTYVGYLFGPLESLNGSVAAAKENLVSAKRVYEIISSQNNVPETTNPVPLNSVDGYIDYRGVSFGYHSDPSVFDNVNLSIKPGQKILFVGPSGGGKSSMLNLLPRFYDPREGVIYIDGKDIRTFKISDLRRQFSIVSQEPMMIAGTIADNIAFGSTDPSITKNSIEIRAAAEAADAHKFIEKLPKKYDTFVGPDGSVISGGQKQRMQSPEPS
jgi:ATP-binding cassette, subfamily B, bacterial